MKKRSQFRTKVLFLHYMKFALTFLLYLFTHQLAAQVIALKGEVVDAETGDPVSFAHVGICGKSIGAVANDNGEYIFNMPDYIGDDTLCASAIGYETFKIEVRVIKDLTSLKIELKPQVNVLNEVLIKDERITARRVIEKAIKRIRRNYPSATYIMEGYYRDYLKKNNEYISFLEGALAVRDPGFRKPVSKMVLQIHQLRNSKTYVKNFKDYVKDLGSDSTKILIHGVSPAFTGNEFSNMQSQNPIRNHAVSVPFIGVFDDFFKRSYSFQIEYYTKYNGKEVYVISIAPNENFRFTHVTIEGKLFIRTDNYAIVKFSYAYFVTQRLETKKWFELNQEYREVDGKMYLKYISYMNYFKLLTTEEVADFFLYREFFVNEVRFGPIDPMAGPLIDNSRPLYQQNAPDDPEFWATYNRTLLEQPLKE